MSPRSRLAKGVLITSTVMTTLAVVNLILLAAIHGLHHQDHHHGSHSHSHSNSHSHSHENIMEQRPVEEPGTVGAHPVDLVDPAAGGAAESGRTLRAMQRRPADVEPMGIPRKQIALPQEAEYEQGHGHGHGGHHGPMHHRHCHGALVFLLVLLAAGVTGMIAGCTECPCAIRAHTILLVVVLVLTVIGAVHHFIRVSHDPHCDHRCKHFAHHIIVASGLVHALILLALIRTSCRFRAVVCDLLESTPVTAVVVPKVVDEVI